MESGTIALATQFGKAGLARRIVEGSIGKTDEIQHADYWTGAVWDVTFRRFGAVPWVAGVLARRVFRARTAACKHAGYTRASPSAHLAAPWQVCSNTFSFTMTFPDTDIFEHHFRTSSFGNQLFDAPGCAMLRAVR